MNNSHVKQTVFWDRTTRNGGYSPGHIIKDGDRVRKMEIYVDDANIPLGRMKMCHMAAVELDQLHMMARKIGLRRKWFQDGRFPHYDLCQSKKRLALGLGAVEVTSQELIGILKGHHQK